MKHLIWVAIAAGLLAGTQAIANKASANKALYKELVAFSENAASTQESKSDYVGGYLFECEITPDVLIGDCLLLQHPEGHPIEVSETLLTSFRSQFGGKSHPEAAYGGVRQTFTLCDESDVTQRLLEEGVSCAGHISRFRHLYRVGPSPEEMEREIERQMSDQPEMPEYAISEITYPGHAQMSSSYPPMAMRDRKNGTVVMDCHWDDEGRFDQCQVLAEYPQGYGFGVTTAFLFRDKASAIPTPDAPDETRWRRFTYRWLLE